MQCQSCETQIAPSFKFCPGCGESLVALANASKLNIPERFLLVISEYEELTKTILTDSQKMRFIEYPPVGKLSVNSSERRIAAAKEVLIASGDGTFKLDVLAWINAMYEVKDPQSNSNERVWMTAGGQKYHKIQDCKGLIDGQTFSSWKGKETYKPQFVTLKDAAWILGKSPCEVCKPKRWS